MALNEVYIDPDTGDDGTGTGTSGAPYATLSGAWSNHTNAGAGNQYRFNIRNTATLTETASLTTDLTTFYASSPTKSTACFIRGVDSSDNPHPIGTYTTLDFTAGTGMINSNSYDWIIFEGMKITQVQVLTTSEAMIRLDNNIHIFNCHFEREDTDTSGIGTTYFQFDGNIRTYNSYFRGVRPSTNGHLWESDLVRHKNSVFVSNDGGSNATSACVALSSADSHMNNCIVIVEDQNMGIRTNSNNIHLMNNTILNTGSSVSSGIEVGGDARWLIGNYVEGFSGSGAYGIEVQSGSEQTFLLRNATYNNTTNYSNSGDNERWNGGETPIVPTESQLQKTGNYNDWRSAYTYADPKRLGDLTWDRFESTLDVNHYIGAVSPEKRAVGAGIRRN